VDKVDPKNIHHQYAVTLLVTEDGRLIGQQRDDKLDIDSPGKVGLFGGSVEPGETPLDTAWRELVGEETNLQIDKGSLVLFFEQINWREMTNEWERGYFFYTKISNEQLNQFEVYEGVGWGEITGPDDPNLAKVVKPAINKFLEL
jgi:8-oxo-dGTP pyrophosphatase MutT (NUDIX family)